MLARVDASTCLPQGVPGVVISVAMAPWAAVDEEEVTAGSVTTAAWDRAVPVTFTSCGEHGLHDHSMCSVIRR